MGTLIGFDEATTYVTPEVQFGLTTSTAYWFDPICPPTRQWNRLDPDCVGGTDTVREELGAIDCNGNDGTQNWMSDWQESGEADGSTAGKMQVVTAAQCAAGNCFQFGGGGAQQKSVGKLIFRERRRLPSHSVTSERLEAMEETSQSKPQGMAGLHRPSFRPTP